jgi:hypothetical protein
MVRGVRRERQYASFTQERTQQGDSYSHWRQIASLARCLPERTAAILTATYLLSSPSVGK